MQRLVKFTVITLVILVMGLGIASILLSRFVDPNQYKDRMTTFVNEKTGYHVTLSGNISWALFPTLGISVENINLKARADAPTAFITLKQATISVKLLPLLDKQVHVDALSVNGVDVHLTVDTRGNSNWQQHQQITAKKINTLTPKVEVINTLASASPKKSASNMAIDIAAIDITKASITYENAQTQKSWRISDFTLHSKNISSTSIFPIKIAFDIDGANPNMNGHMDISSNALFNIKEGIFDFTNMMMQGNIKGDVVGGNDIPIKLAGNINVNNSYQKITFKQIAFDFSNLHVNSSIEYNMRNGEYKGDVSIPAFDVAAFRESINTTSEDKQAVTTRLALDGKLAGNNQFVFLNNTQMLLNDIPLTARIGISSFANQALDITLNGNQVDVAALLAALGKDPRLEGLLTFATRFTTNGSNDDAIKNLNGTGQFEIANAVLKGENLTQKLCEVVAALHKASSSHSRGDDTYFNLLKGSFVVQNGVVHSQDLTAQMKGADVKAQAISHILDKTINADIGITVTGDSDDIACSVNEQYQNIALPIKCKGTYDTEPGKMCGIDKDGFANLAKGTLINKATQKLEDKYGPGVKDALDKLLGN